jgi:hypothetical protein
MGGSPFFLMASHWPPERLPVKEANPVANGPRHLLGVIFVQDLGITTIQTKFMNQGVTVLLGAIRSPNS